MADADRPGPSEPTPPRAPAAPYPPLPRYRKSDGSKRSVKRPLFGGALTVRLPPHYRDVSQVREVPDHQEVWQDCSGGCGDDDKSTSAGGGPCLIVEILAYQDEVDDEDAGKFFFDDLADANGCASSSPSSRRVVGTGVMCVGVREADEEDCDDDDNAGSDGGETGAAEKDGDGDGGANLLPNLRTRTAASLCVGYQRIAKDGRGFDLAGESRTEGRGEAEWVRVELCAIRLRRIMTDLLVTLSTPAGKSPPVPAEEDAKTKRRERVAFSEEFRDVLRSLSVDDWTLFA